MVLDRNIACQSCLFTSFAGNINIASKEQYLRGGVVFIKVEVKTIVN